MAFNQKKLAFLSYSVTVFLEISKDALTLLIVTDFSAFCFSIVYESQMFLDKFFPIRAKVSIFIIFGRA